MGSDVSKTVFRGILIPDPMINTDTLSVTYSDYSQAGPTPGVPEDTSSPASKMVLQTSGVQPAGSNIRLEALRGGFPGLSERAGGFAYQDTTDSTWFGWDTPNIFLGWESISFTSNAGVLARYQQPQIIRLLSGNLLLVMRGSGTLVSGGTTDYIASVRVFNADTGAWSTIGNITPRNNVNSNMYPCLCQLPSGRVLLFFWVVNADTDEANIEMWYSDDDGDNWEIGSEFCLEDNIDTAAYNVKRLRACYNMGQVLLVGQIDFQAPTGFNEPEALVQWASDDLGTRFSHIFTFDHEAAESGAFHDILPLANGGFYVAYQQTVFNNYIYAKRINNAYHSLGDVSSETVPIRENSGDDLAMWSGEDGTWYLAYYTPGVSYDTTVIRSLDEGVNWVRMEGSTGTSSFHGLWKDGDGQVYPTDFTAAETRGRTAFVTRWVTPVATNDLYSVSTLWLGGHSNLTMPSYSLFRDDITQMAWTRTWIGMEEPENYGDVWDAHPSGTPTVLIASAGLHITTDNPDANWYDLDTTAAPYPPSEIDVDFIYFCQFKVVSGGSLNARYVAIQVRTADSTDDYEAHIYLTTTGYRVRDANTGLQIGSDQTIDLTELSQLLISLSEGRVRTWHRNVPNDGDLERQWTTGINQTLTNDSTTPNTYGDFAWGHISSGGAGAESYWQIMCWGQMPNGVAGLSGGQTNPDDLNPRFFARLPTGLPVGTRIQAVDGPVFTGETFSINTRYQYPITHIDPAIAPSPRQTWRSTDTTEQVIAWEMSDVNRRSFTKNMALFLMNTNIPTFTVAGRDSGGGWTTLATVTNGYRDLKFTRYGDALFVDTGSTNPTSVKWIQHSELVGGHLVLTSGTDKYRRVGSNSDGIWTEATAQRPVIHIHPDDYDGTEHASGDLDVIFPNVGVTMLNMGNYHALRITIPAATTAEGYFYIGNVVAGNLALFGQQYSHGRTVELQPNTESTTRRGGTRYTRKLGPPRRIVEFAWQEGVDQTAVSGADPRPNYQTPSSTGTQQPVASPASTPMMMEGILDYLGGADKPVVYVPHVNRASGSGVETETFFHKRDLVYGRITSPNRLETILGDEESNTRGEVSRVATVTIEEEV